MHQGPIPTRPIVGRNKETTTESRAEAIVSTSSIPSHANHGDHTRRHTRPDNELQTPTGQHAGNFHRFVRGEMLLLFGSAKDRQRIRSITLL